jgi:hypothetical protein
MPAADWILADVGSFLVRALIMPQPVLKKVSLPFDASKPCGCSLEISDLLRQRSFAVESDQRCR